MLPGLDLAIVVAYLVVTVVVGVVFTRFVRGRDDFMVAGRSLGTWLALASLTGSELALITIMYSAQKGFSGGFASFHIAVIAGLMALFVGVTGFVIVPLRRAGVVTVPEFYEKRFGRRTRILGGILLTCGGVLNFGLFLKVGADFVVGVTGLDPRGSALVAVMLSLLAIVLLYTMLGGMVSVVLNDYVQFVVVALGLLLLVALGWRHFGWEGLVDTVQRLRDRPGFDPTVKGSGFGPEYMGWQAILGLVSCAIWPTAVARALAARDTGVVRRQFMLASVTFLIRFLLPYFVGICAFVWLAQKNATFWCMDLAVAGGTVLPGKPTGFALPGHGQEDSLLAFPRYIRATVPSGLLGLVVAAMLAAFMSNLSSYLMTWAASITRDVVAPFRKGGLTQGAEIGLTRVFVFLIGAWLVVYGLFVDVGTDVWDYLGITGAIYFTGAIPVLVLGIYWRRASSAGAVGALLCGFSALLGLRPVQNWLGRGTLAHPYWPEAWVGLFTLGLAVAVMVALSIWMPDGERAEGGER
jgi:SSS family solute:Na+ symporter